MDFRQLEIDDCTYVVDKSIGEDIIVPSQLSQCQALSFRRSHFLLLVLHCECGRSTKDDVDIQGKRGRGSAESRSWRKGGRKHDMQGTSDMLTIGKYRSSKTRVNEFAGAKKK